MKKLLFIIIVIIAVSCSKDDPEPKTTYQIENTMSYDNSGIEYLDGSIYEVVVFCYFDSDIIRQDNITKIKYSTESEIKELPDKCNKIKVSFRFLPPESAFYEMSSNNRKYVVSSLIIEKGKNNKFTIADNTMLRQTLD